MEKGRHDGVDNAAKVLTLPNLQGYMSPCAPTGLCRSPCKCVGFFDST